MGAEQSAPAAGPMSEEEAAAKIQAINRGNKSRREFGSPAAAGGKGNIMMITVTRKKKSAMPFSSRPRVGIELDADNVVVSLVKPASESEMQVGDTILEVDGHGVSAARGRACRTRTHAAGRTPRRGRLFSACTSLLLRFLTGSSLSLSLSLARATTQLGPDALLQDVMIQHNLAKNESHTFKVMRPSAVPVI